MGGGFSAGRTAGGRGGGRGGSGRHDADGVAGGRGGIEGDDDLFLGKRGDEEAGVIGGDGHQAAAAVDEDGEFDFGRAAVVEEFVEGGFDGAAGEEDVVDEDDRGAMDIGGDVRGGEFFRDGVATDVVAVEGDVDGACRRGELRVGGGKRGGDTAGELDAAVGDAEEEQFFRGEVAGGNSGRELRDRSVYFRGADSLKSGHEGGLRRVRRGEGRFFWRGRRRG